MSDLSTQNWVALSDKRLCYLSSNILIFSYKSSKGLLIYGMLLVLKWLKRKEVVRVFSVTNNWLGCFTSPNKLSFALNDFCQ